MADAAISALTLTAGNLRSLIGARVNLGLREEADQNLRIMGAWLHEVEQALSVVVRNECICPKCGIRHGGRNTATGDF